MIKPEMKVVQGGKPEPDYKKHADILAQQRDRATQALLNMELQLSLMAEENKALVEENKALKGQDKKIEQGKA